MNINPLYDDKVREGIDKRGLASLAALTGRTPAHVSLSVKTTYSRTGGPGFYDGDISVNIRGYTSENGMGGGRSAYLEAEFLLHITNSGDICRTQRDDEWGVVVAHPMTEDETHFIGPTVVETARKLFDEWCRQQQLRQLGATTAGYATWRGLELDMPSPEQVRMAMEATRTGARMYNIIEQTQGWVRQVPEGAYGAPRPISEGEPLPPGVQTLKDWLPFVPQWMVCTVDGQPYWLADWPELPGEFRVPFMEGTRVEG